MERKVRKTEKKERICRKEREIKEERKNIRSKRDIKCLSMSFASVIYKIRKNNIKYTNEYIYIVCVCVIICNPTDLTPVVNLVLSSSHWIKQMLLYNLIQL